MHRTLSLLSLALACAPQPAASPAVAAGDHALVLSHAGAERSYRLHVPAPRRGAPLPLVLAFHGGGGSAAGFQRYAGLDVLADREGFLVAYPNGTGRLFSERLLTWNAGPCCGYAAEVGSDDVGFALAVVEDVARRTQLDRSRVYATGHSNGAMLTYRLAAEASDRIAAIAPVAGAVALAPLAPRRPVPVLHIHSRDDPRAFYAGGVNERWGRDIQHPSVEAELAHWRRRAHCPAEARTLEERTWSPPSGSPHGASLRVWGPCDRGSEIRLWTLTGAGHGWPGAGPVLPERWMGPPSDVLSAADEVWAFVSRFQHERAPER